RRFAVARTCSTAACPRARPLPGHEVDEASPHEGCLDAPGSPRTFRRVKITSSQTAGDVGRRAGPRAQRHPVCTFHPCDPWSSPCFATGDADMRNPKHGPLMGLACLVLALVALLLVASRPADAQFEARARWVFDGGDRWLQQTEPGQWAEFVNG